MTPETFIRDWKASTLNEKEGAHLHFDGLCKLLGVAPPSANSKDVGYSFEQFVEKVGGGGGYADVRKRGCFAWEYKSPGGDLKAALKQLKLYASDLENPPLLIVSDMRRIEIHTNWTNMVQESHALELDDLADVRLRQKLKWAFDAATVEQLKPHRAADATTKEVAQKFASIAQNLRARGEDPEKVAHFVNRMVFCMFAEDVDLLPKKMFEQMLAASLNDPGEFVPNAEQLFTAMAKKHGRVGYDAIEWFNGGLFEDGSALPLMRDDIKIALDAAKQNWSEINPSIMGTLFERGLDPGKRSQLGAHYTDAEKIMMIVRPVIIEPLLREWADKRAEIEAELAKVKVRATSKKEAELSTKAKKAAEKLRIDFLERLKNFRVLDPACGSGNFLYLALKSLKDIEARVNIEAESLGLQPQSPAVGPECVRGIEINPFAAELARVSVWIGEIQWMREKGFGVSKNPILKSLETIECRDALLNPDGSEAEWPEADVIIGNPPFLGVYKIPDLLGLDYTKHLRSIYRESVPNSADLVTYWFAKSWSLVFEQKIDRVGLVATNSIRGGSNRDTIISIVDNGQIFNAWSDEHWAIDGAAVRVSLICFDGGEEKVVSLDGVHVPIIYSDLSTSNTGIDITNPHHIIANIGSCVRGVETGGPFEIDRSTFERLALAPTNPNGLINAVVLRRVLNGNDILKRPPDRFVVDFHSFPARDQAALFQDAWRALELAYESYFRESRRRLVKRDKWWLHRRSGAELRHLMQNLVRCIVTPRVSKFRTFVYTDCRLLPDSATFVIARDDDTTFGVLHSKFHELWSLRMCTWLGVGNDPRYTPTTCFETFPFPEGLAPNIPAADYASDPRAQAIAKAAARLNELREKWLSPPDLVQRVPEVVPGYPDRILPVDDKAAKILKDRTLTKLYNERPAWLDHAHKDLDKAVAAAYGWANDLSDDEILERLFKLNQDRAAKQ